MVKKTKPKEEYGYYCDLCGEEICKYLADFKACGGHYVFLDRAVDVEPEKEICHSCLRNVAEEAIDSL